MIVTHSLTHPGNERQRCVNDFLSCMLDNIRVKQPLQPIIVVSTASMGKNATDDIATTSQK